MVESSDAQVAFSSILPGTGINIERNRGTQMIKGNTDDKYVALRLVPPTQLQVYRSWEGLYDTGPTGSLWGALFCEGKKDFYPGINRAD